MESSPAMPLKALIFDVDGTLAETEEVHRQAFNETFESHGLDWTWSPELYRKLLRITGGRERIRHYVERWSPQGGDAALAHLAEMHAEKSNRYASLVTARGGDPRLGIRRLIRDAHDQGLRLAIATTTSAGNVEPLLRAFLGEDAASWFSVIAAGDIVPSKKPAPDIYFHALRQLRVDASCCVAFEDSENGVRAASQAGLAVVATPSLYSSADDFSAATSLLSDLGEPDRPHRHIAGWRFSKDYVDLDGLQALLRREQATCERLREGIA